MKRLIILVTGLAKLHGRGQPRPGLPETYEELVSTNNDENTKIVLYRWGTVEQIVKDILEYDPEYILAAGHSYGVSTLLMVAASLLTKEVIEKENKHYKINDLISMDGVWREKIDSPQFKSLFKKHKLYVTTNVKRLYVYYQTKGVIRGHGFELNRHYTQLKEFAELTAYTHQKFDRAPEPNKLLKQLALEGKP